MQKILLLRSFMHFTSLLRQSGPHNPHEVFIGAMPADYSEHIMKKIMAFLAMQPGHCEHVHPLKNKLGRLSPTLGRC